MPKTPKRKLKTYQTSLGFYDQAIAAPSMKAALDAWGARSNLFHQGAAKETDDPDIVAATMEKPGVVLRRPVGSDGAFTEHSALPTDLADDAAKPKKSKAKSKPKKRPAKAAKQPSRKIDDQQARKAAAAFAKEEKRREAAAPQGGGRPRQGARASRESGRERAGGAGRGEAGARRAGGGDRSGTRRAR